MTLENFLRHRLSIMKVKMRIFRFAIIFAVVGAVLTMTSCSEKVESNKVERNAIKAGNKAFKEHNFNEAMSYYNKALEANPSSEVAKYDLALATLISYESDSTQRQTADQYLKELAQSAKNPEVSENALYTMSNFSVYVGDELKAQSESDADQQMAQELSKKSTEFYKQAIELYKELLRRKPGDLKVTQNLRITQLKLPPEDNQDNDQNQDQQNQEQQNQQDQQQQQQQQQQPQADALNALEKREAQTRKKQVQPQQAERPTTDKPW